MTTTQRLVNKVAIVTGSSSGLGRAIALAYSREGAHVVCADLRPEARSLVAAETEVKTDDMIRQSGKRAIFVKTDVSSAEDIANLVRKAVEEFGRVDILVNNAGVALEAGRAPMRIHETPDDIWDTTMAINARSVFLATKAVVAQMLRQEPHAPSGHRGWIVNLASVYGLVGGRNFVSYAASKGAVVNITRQVALDYAGDKIHCNAICPGFVNTAIYTESTQNIASAQVIADMHPWGSVGTPQDIAGAAVFLASDEAGWITGAALPVDGGFTAQ